MAQKLCIFKQFSKDAKGAGLRLPVNNKALQHKPHFFLTFLFIMPETVIFLSFFQRRQQ